MILLASIYSLSLSLGSLRVETKKNAKPILASGFCFGDEVIMFVILLISSEFLRLSKPLSHEYLILESLLRHVGINRHDGILFKSWPQNIGYHLRLHVIGPPLREVAETWNTAHAGN